MLQVIHAVQAFVDADFYATRCGDARHAGNVVTRDRLLKKFDARVGNAAHEPDGFVRRPRLVGIGADQHLVILYRCADRTRTFGVGFR